jgi:hypothetical protein
MKKLSEKTSRGKTISEKKAPKIEQRMNYVTVTVSQGFCSRMELFTKNVFLKFVVCMRKVKKNLSEEKVKKFQ